MFDLKQAMYLRFLDAFSCGIFAAASDDIESFIDFPDDFNKLKADLDRLNSEDPALFSLAHPSSLQIGKNHGVFSLSQASLSNLQSASVLLVQDCLKVVQKPSIEEMKTKGLIVVSDNSETVYTDSAYWMNQPLVKQLVDFAMNQESEIEEFSMYSDFMTRQRGKEASTSRREDPSNLKSIQPLLEIASKVPIYLLALSKSKFYHLGTTNEYLDMVQKCLRIRKSLSNEKSFISCSNVPAQLNIPHGCVLDHTVISTNTIQLQPKTILSNCHIPVEIDVIKLPGDHVYATVPIEFKPEQTAESVHGFVSMITHINEDVKGVYGSFNELQSKTVIKLPLGVKFTGGCFSLWNAKIYPMETSKSRSFLASFRTFFSGETLTLGKEVMHFSCDDLMKMRSNNRIVEEFL